LAVFPGLVLAALGRVDGPTASTVFRKPRRSAEVHGAVVGHPRETGRHPRAAGDPCPGTRKSLATCP